ncbi:flagellar hook-basal body family protein, partial [Vibrio parahaemolyticus V-223/04]
AMVSSK